ncbi:MAG TPA: CheR family methyltransferase [Polyangiales bacterium]|jgi:chemotaxis protein methyltransferase CheR|nr:CheR family methyltransferase [Polyangiales bacterium]
MSELPMTPQVFAILSGLIEERLGLSYALADQALLENKIAVRVLERGFDSALDYYYYLRYDDAEGAELDQLAELLVVNETFFFREYDQLQAALQHVATLVAAGKRPRIWCAACSTGEEPITIAFWLAERNLLDSVELIASDISSAALALARKGRYRPRSLRHVPPDVDPSRFIEKHGDSLVVNPRLVDAIQWRKLNLMDGSAVSAMGELDVVLCRNLLIYFRDDVVRRVVGQLADRLTDDGVLLVGVSESLMRFGTRLVCEEHQGAFFYRKAH